jgi:hypothetical protein
MIVIIAGILAGIAYRRHRAKNSAANKRYLGDKMKLAEMLMGTSTFHTGKRLNGLGRK